MALVSHGRSGVSGAKGGAGFMACAALFVLSPFLCWGYSPHPLAAFAALCSGDCRDNNPSSTFHGVGTAAHCSVTRRCVAFFVCHLPNPGAFRPLRVLSFYRVQLTDLGPGQPGNQSRCLPFREPLRLEIMTQADKFQVCPRKSPK